MTGVSSPIGRFRLVVVVGWVLLAAAAVVYARNARVPIPAAIAIPVALAFLVEYPFYVLPGFAAARERLMAHGKLAAACVFAVAALLPWLIYALGTGHFNVAALVVLTSVALLMCFWYVLFPAHPAADLIYLGLFGAIMLFKVFARVYPPPLPKLDVSILGQVMLIRVMAFSFVAIRGHAGADYRFMPVVREWLAGLRWFALLLPVVTAAYWGLGLVKLRPHPLSVANILIVVGTFWGILWVTAIFEEFIFRGLLQPWIERWTSSAIAALVTASLLFGSVHLGFHGPFPNWRIAICAAILGLFCGLARRQTGGIQAGMVAHALTVAVWRMFLV